MSPTNLSNAEAAEVTIQQLENLSSRISTEDNPAVSKKATIKKIDLIIELLRFYNPGVGSSKSE